MARGSERNSRVNGGVMCITSPVLLFIFISLSLSLSLKVADSTHGLI